MSSWPLVQYVDAPSTSATVRYDFNDQTGTPVKKVTEFDPGVPTLEGDPDAVGQQWGFRSPSITHTIRGTKAQAMAALSAVSREQLRHTNWLMFQPAAGTQPVWFKTYRTGYQPITLDQVWVQPASGAAAPVPDTWKITVPLVADAFAYGARVTIPTLQIVQGPTDLTGPTRTAMRAVLPPIKGDAPTPLRVSILPAAGRANPSTGNPARYLIGCVAGSASMADPVMGVGTGDGLTVVSGTGTVTTDAAFFGGSYRAFTITSGIASIRSRLRGNGPAMPPGRYTVLARVSATQVFTLRLGSNGALASTDDYGGSADAGDGWVDLGEIQNGVPSLPADVSPGTATPFIDLHIGGAAGVTTVIGVDAFKFIPVDGPMVTRASLLTADFTSGQPPSAWATPQSGVFDGGTEVYYATTATAPLAGAPALRGGFPVADPAAAQNLLIVMALQRGPFPASDAYVTALNSQAAVDVSYHPLYLHLGDGH